MKLELFIKGNGTGQSDNWHDPALRCGNSKAGQAFQEVLAILDDLEITYTLLFEEDDLDIRIQYHGKECLCEIVLNENAEKPVEGIRIKKGQLERWSELNADTGILYYYMRLGRLELYCLKEENRFLTCLRE